MIFYMTCVGILLPPGLSATVPNGIAIALVLVSALSKYLSSEEIASKSACKVVANYMRDREQYEAPTTYITDYTYQVTSTTTVRDIYSWDYGEWEQATEGRRLCLSFALFRLLYCRYQNITSFEDKVPTPRTGLISEENNRQVDWGFKVIEVELAFLHGYIHNGHVLWSGPRWCIAYTALVVKAVLMYVGILLLSHAGESIALFVLQVVFDLVQIICHCNSNRWMVYHMYRCLPGPLSRFHRFIASQNMTRLLPWNDNWQDGIGQLSLMEDKILTYSFPLRNLLKGSITRPEFIHCAAERTPIASISVLRVKIAGFLRRQGNVELGGLPCLVNRQHRIEGCSTNTILTWHIATIYCQIACRHGIELPDGYGYAAAVTLSRYCAYLVTFRPKLIPNMLTESLDKLEEILEEVRALKGKLTLTKLDERRGLAVPTDVEEGNVKKPRDGYAILTDGLNLGWYLVDQIRSAKDRWNILENIWINMVLRIAIQDATGHTDCLAQGGEFLTHLWAMMSHATVLLVNKPKWSEADVHVYDHGKPADDLIAELVENYLKY